MASAIERRKLGYTWGGGYGYRPLDVRAAAGLGRVAFGELQLANINVNPTVCAAVAGLVGAAGGFFGARGALKGKGLSKKKMQQQIAMYAVGATAAAALVGYFLCRRPAAAEPASEPKTAKPPISRLFLAPLEPPK